MKSDTTGSKKTFSIRFAFSVIQGVLVTGTVFLLVYHLANLKLSEGVDWLSLLAVLVLGAILLFVLIVPRLFMRSFSQLERRLETADPELEVVPFSAMSIREINKIGYGLDRLIIRLQETSSDLQKEIEAHEDSKAQLAWSETLYRSVVEDSPGLLCIFLPDGEITFANKSYAEYYGIKTEEIVGRSFLDFLHEDDREYVMSEIRALNKEHPSNSLMQRVYLPSGEVHHQRWINRALFSENGEVIGYQAFGEDIQQEYQTQQSQRALYRIWRAANQVATLDELYISLHKIIQEIIPVENFIIALIDEETHMPVPVYYVDEKDEVPEFPHEYRGPASYVSGQNTSLLCTPDEFFELVPDISPADIYGTRPKIWLGVPLLLEEHTVGLMILQDYHNENAFGPSDQEFLEMIAPSVAATIARRRTEEKLKNYAQTNALLFEASQIINEALSFDELYEALYQFVAREMDCCFFMLSDYDRKTESITCEYLVKEGRVHDVSEFSPLPFIADGTDNQSRVISEKKSRLIADSLAEGASSQISYYLNKDVHSHDGVEPGEEVFARSTLVVPLIFGGDVSGVIQVMSCREDVYSHEDLRLVEALSNQIAVARNNIRLYQQAQAEIRLRKDTEKSLQSLNAELEERVQDRTRELHERVESVERLNTGMSNILHDLNIANKLAEKNARNLIETNAELEAFSYSVSHDLRAPLRHIESFTELLHQRLDDRLEESEERYFQNIFTATQKMQNLIQDMLTLSRASRVEFKLAQLDMLQIIESVRKELFDEIEGRNIEWKLDSFPPVYADAGLIKIVWTNLIGNAIKYTRPRETAVIEIGTLPPEDVIGSKNNQVFYIRDNGVGFDETYLDNLFGVFQRLHQVDEFEGNGIGLATVRRIISRHGGRVWAEGTLNEGAIFYFSLPIHIRPE